MYLIIKGTFSENSHVLMQHVGYASHRSPGEISYTKRFGGELYPRFHAYPQEVDGGLRINLHLDMKQHTYEGFTRHQGEYDGKTVEVEMERIREYIERHRSDTSVTQAESPSTETPPPKKRGFMRGIY